MFFSRIEMTSWWSFRILQAGVSLFVFDKYVIVFIFHCEGQWRLIVLRGYSGYSSCSVPMQPMQQMQQMQAPQARDLMKNGLFPKVWWCMIQDVFKIQEIFKCRLGKLEEKRFKIQNIGCGVGGESVRFLELLGRFRSPKCSAFISTMVVDLNTHHLPT